MSSNNKKIKAVDYTTGILLGLMLFLGGSVVADQLTPPPGNTLSVAMVEGP
jgi:hypothetical protein